MPKHEFIIPIVLDGKDAAMLGDTAEEAGEQLRLLLQANLPELIRFFALIKSMHNNQFTRKEKTGKPQSISDDTAAPNNEL